MARRRRSVFLTVVGTLLILTGLLVAIHGPALLNPREPATPQAAAGVAGGPAERLTAALDRYLANRPERVSVAVTHHASGFAATYRPEHTFETASIVKINLLATLLLQVQDAARELTEAEKQLAGKMIAGSDNASTNALWRQVGGADQVAAANRRLGLGATEPNVEGWGRTTTTASDQLRLLSILLQGGGAIGASGVDQARKLMGTVADSQAWGVSAGARPGEVVELKNGWDTRSGDRNRWIVHTAGAIRTSSGAITLVVLSDGNLSERDGIDLVEQVAKLVRAGLPQG